MSGGKDIIYDVQRIDPSTCFKRDADGMEPGSGLENDAKRSRHQETNEDENNKEFIGNERIDGESSERIDPQNTIECDKNSGDQSKSGDDKMVAVPPVNERKLSSSGTVLDGSDKTNEIAVVEDNQSEGGSSSGNPRTGYSRGHLILSSNPGEEERWRGK